MWGLPDWVAFSDTPFGVVYYLLVVNKGVFPVMGLTAVSAKGGVIIPGEVVCCPGKVVTGKASGARVGLNGIHCAPFESATAAATLIGA